LQLGNVDSEIAPQFTQEDKEILRLILLELHGLMMIVPSKSQLFTSYYFRLGRIAPNVLGLELQNVNFVNNYSGQCIEVDHEKEEYASKFSKAIKEPGVLQALLEGYLFKHFSSLVLGIGRALCERPCVFTIFLQGITSDPWDEEHIQSADGFVPIDMHGPRGEKMVLTSKGLEKK
jgi:hypothetical protein